MSLSSDSSLMSFTLFSWVPPPSLSDNSIMESPFTSSVGPTLVGSSSSMSLTDMHLDNAGADDAGVDAAEARDLCATFFWDWEMEGWVGLSASFSLVSVTFLDFVVVIIVEG